VLDDFITPEHAREAYGVVLKSADDGFAWALDVAATETLRSSMRS
jgi:N-methylhydantoinase B